VTIAAGLVCVDGIVMCADSQETSGDYKWPVEKMVIDSRYGFPLIIAGAGTSGGQTEVALWKTRYAAHWSFGSILLATISAWQSATSVCH
jgi:hypothetical protein